MGYVSCIGFGSVPYSVICWVRDGKEVAKTICYSESDEEEAMNRYYTPEDFYYTFDKAVIYKDDTVTTFTKAKGA